MGTNFYLTTPTERRHIGKSAVGWAFHWQAFPADGIISRDDWARVFRESGDAAIVDEYGSMISLDEFRESAFIENRDPEGALRRFVTDDPDAVVHPWTKRYADAEYLDPRGEVFTAEEFS